MRIAIITPGFLPVPAVDGGAIETLITYILEGNDKHSNSIIDLFTIESEKLGCINYKNTNIIQVKVRKYDKVIARIRYLINKFCFGKKEYHIAFGKRLISKYLKEEYDYVIIENNMTLYKDIYNNTKYKEKLIFHLHNDIGSNSKPKHLCRLINDTAVYILVVSNYIKNRFDSCCNDNKSKVLYNCSNLEMFNKKNLKKSIVLKRKYNIHDNDIIFMYSGRITEEKGIKELILAFTRIEKNKNAKLLVVGNSWFSNTKEDSFTIELNKLAKELGDRIIFTGYIPFDEMNEIYGISDVVVIPSKCEEAFCMVGLEAMAMGLPIIATNSGGLQEIVDDNCAIILNKEKRLIDQLVRAINVLIHDENKRINMGKSGYSRVNKNNKFNKDNYSRGFFNILNIKKV